MVSPKLDGIRCIIHEGVPVTRTLKPIPNHYVRKQLSGLQAFDGELIVGDPARPDTWNKSSSAVMSHDGEPDFKFHAFDMSYQDEPFRERLRFVGHRAPMYGIQVVTHYWVRSVTELMEFEKKFVDQGFEGLMIRDPDGRYKFGRSTLKEGILLKMKRFDDMEAKVVGLIEKLMYIGKTTRDERGYSKRTHKAEDLEGAGTLGALEVAPVSGPNFSVGSGFDDALRNEIWLNPNRYLDKIVKVKHQGFTPDGKPRFPTFLGFRDIDDQEVFV